MERKLITILALDVVGYSTLMEADEAGTFERLKTLEDQLFKPEIEKHRGRIFKLMGDGLLAEFGSVVDAVECALEVQRELAKRNAHVPTTEHIDVRIGINLGEVIAEGDDRFGEGVNIAARLQQLAEPGAILVSGKVAKEIDRKLPLKLKGMGDQRVKNIVEPISVYEVEPSSAVPSRRPTGGIKPWRSQWPAVLVFVLGVMGAAAYWVQTKATGPEFSHKPSLAVLPFTNIGGDARWQRFADGLTEDIISELSRWRDMIVIARNSTETYKDKPVDVREVGKTLGVRYVLQGSLQERDDQIRVTAQLIDASDGGHVWSERYDKPAKDLFAIQDEVTSKIVGTIAGWQGKIVQASRALTRGKKQTSLDVYDYHQLGPCNKRQ